MRIIRLKIWETKFVDARFHFQEVDFKYVEPDIVASEDSGSEGKLFNLDTIR